MAISLKTFKGITSVIYYEILKLMSLEISNIHGIFKCIVALKTPCNSIISFLFSFIQTKNSNRKLDENSLSLKQKFLHFYTLIYGAIIATKAYA